MAGLLTGMLSKLPTAMLAGWTAVVLAGCSPSNSPAPAPVQPAAAVKSTGAPMGLIDDKLVGAWRRVSGAACAAGYPATLQFQANGLYFGQTDPPGAFTWWDAGTWSLKAPQRLALSTANDAVVDYGYSLNGEQLDFKDDKGCTFGFKRVV